ncbi:putative major facilitator superfamily permease [Encephalitozoon hellem ATCC 50504]|uniref:Lactose-proton symport n=1 Tax=Encephalitozoon hellem TaxID=27973 RepID=A0A9Q9C646_ENCHE|nr:putative major facilitator superfamily permease [Encephalitozoon hellem ATCC 50504]AFM99450.1 putative major facilitator superfamily permease [Encephalitozoon hellem ATCC 50504]UTX44460.1 lactose-proton symport [Encephalitozoon hellem]|eukprot:XP_003888431.1 putative major facilitator superfamily permease [Encephalitozoon hellem ATCC 50504]
MNFLSKLNRKFLLVPKILYIAISMQYYTLHKFRPLFAKEMFGIGESELSAVGLLLFVTFFTNILIATLNDRFGRPRLFMVCLLSLSCIFFQLFYIEKYVRNIRFMFWVNMLAYLGTNTPIMALLDKIILDYLAKFPDVGSRAYGKQRIWGTVGYLLSIFSLEGIMKTGRGTDAIDFTNLKYYSLATTIACVCLVMIFLKDEGDGCKTADHNITSEWKELVGNREYLFFIFIIFLNGFTRAAMTIYLPVYTKYVLGVKPYVLPTSWPMWLRNGLWIFNSFPFATITVFEISLEMGILFYFDVVSRKIGLLWPLLLAQVSQAIRFALYLILPCTNPHVFVFCCIFEVLKGINFGLSHGSGVQLAEKMCPPHLKATSQMIYNGTFTAIGSVAASLYFRYVFKSNETSVPEEIMNRRVESFRMFFISNIVVTSVSIFLFLIKYGLWSRKLFNVFSSPKKINQENVKKGKLSAKDTNESTIRD